MAINNNTADRLLKQSEKKNPPLVMDQAHQMKSDPHTDYEGINSMHHINNASISAEMKTGIMQQAVAKCPQCVH